LRLQWCAGLDDSDFETSQIFVPVEKFVASKKDTEWVAFLAHFSTNDLTTYGIVVWGDFTITYLASGGLR
jgi:hypothetical protein